MSTNLPTLAFLASPLVHTALGRASSAIRVAQRNSKAQLAFMHFSTGWHLWPLKHPWISSGAECLSSAKRLAIMSLDFREAFCINPDCATSALWIKRGFYFPELSIWYFSMLNKFAFSINKKITKKDDELQDDLGLKFLAAFPFLVRDQDILLQLHSARSYGNLILILKWCFQMYVLLIEELILIYLSYWTEKEQ